MPNPPINSASGKDLSMDAYVILMAIAFMVIAFAIIQRSGK